MTYKLIISGRLAGMNEYTEQNRRNKYAGASMKAKEQAKVEWAIRDQLRTVKKLNPPVNLSYTYYEPNKRRDKDNISAFAHKVVQDALTKTGLLENDGWAEIGSFQDDFFVSKEDPRIEVRIEEI